jgi:hypothetical protein
MVTECMRTRPLTTKMTRSKQIIKDQKRKVQIGVWVDPIVKDEIERRAKREGLTVSATASALIARALQQTIDMEYGPLLVPAIKEAVEKNLQKRFIGINRMLARQTLAAEQTKAVSINVLGRQPGMTQKILDHILEESAAYARRKLTQQAPELEKVLRELETGLIEEEEPDGNLN